MAFGKVDDRFWTDEKIRSYSDAGKLLALYLLTSPHRTLIGCYRLPIGYICDDLRWTADQVATVLTELASGERPFIVRDRDGWTVIVNFLRYEKFTSPNHFKSADYLLSRIPKESPVFTIVCAGLSQIWRDDWCRRPKYLEAASQLPLAYLPVASDEPRTSYPAPAPAPAPAPIQNHRNGSDADAPVEPSLKAKLFGECLTWMANLNGKDPSKYRSIIGQWISRYGEAETLAAFIKAQRGDPGGSPVAYIEAILRGSHGQRTNPHEQLSPGAAAARIFAKARSRGGAGGDINDD